MDTNWYFVFSFILGIFFQAIFSIDIFSDFKKNIKLLGKLFILSLLGLLPGKREKNYLLGNHLLLASMLYCFFIVVFFKEKIFTTLNEKTLLIINFITLYLVFKNNFPLPVIVFYSILTSIIVFNAIIPVRLKDWQEIALYFWYIILIITIPIAHFDFSEMYSSFLGQNMTHSFQSSLVLGMSFSFIITNVMLIVEFFLSFIRHKKETLEALARRKEQQRKFLTDRYEDSIQMRPYQALFMISVTLFILIINYYFSIVSDSIVIIISLLSSTLIGRQIPHINTQK